VIIETLKRSIVFNSLLPGELKKISDLFEKLNFNKNEYVFIEGDPSGWFYLVASGDIKILKHTIMGKDIILEVMSPGDIFGGVAVLDKKPFPASAQAKDSVTVIRISRNNLFKIMEEYPVLKLEIVKYFSEKLRDAHEMLKNIATERVEKRIAFLLIKLSEKTGKNEGIYLKIGFPLTRQEIAEMVGTTVETCIRTMSKFQKMGMIKTANGKILIKVDGFKRFLED